MKFRIITSILFSSIFLIGYCQSESRDSLLYVPMGIDSLQLQSPLNQDSLRIFENNYRIEVSEPVWEDFNPRRVTDTKEIYIPGLNFTPGQAVLYNWHTGGIIATGGSESYPGLMNVANGSVGASQSFGNFDVYMGATANKYAWYRGLYTQYGVNGAVSYQFTPRLSATLYGSYYFGKRPYMANGMPLPPSLLGYYDYTKFGGCINYEINERFGVAVGAQAVKNTYGTRYEFEPIATPYVKVGRKKKVEIGLPVGQILYQILRR